MRVCVRACVRVCVCARPCVFTARASASALLLRPLAFTMRTFCPAVAAPHSQISLKEAAIVVGILSGYGVSYGLAGVAGGWRQIFDTAVPLAVALGAGMVS